MKVLILDASYEQTLAMVRHLGKLNTVDVSAVGYYKFSLSFFSKFCKQHFVITSPYNNARLFCYELLNILKADKYDLLIPVGYKTCQICVEKQEELSKYVNLVLPSISAFSIASDKAESCRFAQKIGVGVPLFSQPESLDNITQDSVKFPVVVKSPIELEQKAVVIANSKEELTDRYRYIYSMCRPYNILPLLQEKVEGELHSFFAFYDNGACKAYFMHKRIRQYPIKNGSAICAESIYNEKLLENGKKILDALKWNGVAMIEFIKDEKDGEYKLIEINPKFWRTVELPIIAGIDFPGFLLKRVKGENVAYIHTYKKVKFHWLIYGELYYFLLSLGLFLRF